jgi:hypothetical protein
MAGLPTHPMLATWIQLLEAIGLCHPIEGLQKVENVRKVVQCTVVAARTPWLHTCWVARDSCWGNIIDQLCLLSCAIAASYTANHNTQDD